MKTTTVSRSFALACALSLSMTALGSGTLGISQAYAQGGYVATQAYFSQEQIDQLVAPIALYPDPLLAQVLAAAAYPAEIGAAHAYVRSYGAGAGVDRQPWDNSVRAVAHYPTALNWLAADLGRTQALGIAFINQPDAVANSIQRWRAQAYGLGNLYSTPQQVVYVEGDYVRIVPAQPTIIYVPVYEPRVIYVEPYRPNYAFLTFGLGLAIGIWLDHDWDWHRHRVYYYDRRYWQYGRPVFYAQFDRVYVDRDREWRPERTHFRPPTQVVYPTRLTQQAVVPPPPPDRRPRDRQTMPGGKLDPSPTSAPTGIVPPPGKGAPDLQTKPTDRDNRGPNGRPLPPGQQQGKPTTGPTTAPTTGPGAAPDKPKGPPATAPGANVAPPHPVPAAPGTATPADGGKGPPGKDVDRPVTPPGANVAPPRPVPAAPGTATPADGGKGPPGKDVDRPVTPGTSSAPQPAPGAMGNPKSGGQGQGQPQGGRVNQPDNTRTAAPPAGQPAPAAPAKKDEPKDNGKGDGGPPEKKTN